MPISGQSAPTVSATRAALLDELLPAAIPNDLNWLMTNLTTVLADVTGIAGDAMRGTDGVKGFTAYYYTGLLADNAQYVPAEGTILEFMYISGAPLAVDEWTLEYAATGFQDAFSHPLTDFENSLFGPVYCDGTNIGPRNQTGGQETIRLIGRAYS